MKRCVLTASGNHKGIVEVDERQLIDLFADAKGKKRVDVFIYLFISYAMWWLRS